jgi:hypothetical protein
MKLLSVITTNSRCVLFRYVLSARIQNGYCQSINSGLGFRSVGNAQDFIFSNFIGVPRDSTVANEIGGAISILRAIEELNRSRKVA